MGSPARNLRHDAREDLVSSWGPEQGLLVERSPEFAAYCETFAPGLSRNAKAYAGRTRIEVERLRGEIEEHEFVERRSVDLRRILAAAWIAGTTGEAEPIDAKTDVVAVHLAYHLDRRVRFVCLDLDGTTTDPAKIIAALRADIGEDSFLVTSGSGREGRYRVWMRLDKSKTIADLQTFTNRWIAGLGFQVAQGDLEVFPGTKNGRCAFGLGGCTRFAPDLSTRQNELPIDLWQRFVELKPIDLRALALRFPALEFKQQSPQNASNEGVSREYSLPNTKQSLPRRYVAERRPPTPKTIRELAKHGISGTGERDDAIYKLMHDRFCRGYSQEETIEYIRAFIEAGKLDRSRALQKPSGKAQQMRDVARRVARHYATHERPGRPLPRELTPNEAARIAEGAAIVAVASGFSEAALRALLHGILPLFKAARTAGLPHVRIHTWEWRKAGGSRAAQLRDATGIFAPTTSYRSAQSLRKRGLKDRASVEHAYAKSWETSFIFDV